METRVFDLAIQNFVNWVENNQTYRFQNYYGKGKAIYYQGIEKEAKVTAKNGNRWIKVDVRTSGRFMIDKDGSIYCIKAYGVPNLHKKVGSIFDRQWDERKELLTIEEWQGRNLK